jgi:hypothetical protein
MTLTHQGVNYDVGTNYLPRGGLSRQVWERDLVRQEIRAIRDELHCTAIGIFGTDVDRIVEAATVALEDGLTVWLQPRLVDAGPQDTLDHLAKAAAAAEALRRRYAAVTLNVGCELSVFSAGIIPGASYQQRSSRLSSPRYWPLIPWYNRKLNALLAKAAAVARSGFNGQLTYGAGLWERVNWAPFDVVGLDYYRLRYNRSRYVSTLRKLRRHGKPVVIVEFGCGSYQGAADKGPSSHEIIDFDRPVPQLTGSYRRDEQVQADTIAELLGIYEAEGVHGAFVFEFIEPYNPHADDPRYDLDMAGYGIVKVLPGDQERPYRWEPKAAFHAVARLYGANRQTSSPDDG